MVTKGLSHHQLKDGAANSNDMDTKSIRNERKRRIESILYRSRE